MIAPPLPDPDFVARILAKRIAEAEQRAAYWQGVAEELMKTQEEATNG